MRRVILAIVSTVTALVFLLSFKTHSSSALAAAPVASASASPTKSSASASAGSTASASSSASSGSTASSSSSTAKTYTGNAVDTMYGAVEVRITVASGKVTKAEAVEYPDSQPRDEQINSYAIPQLNSEAVAAGSAQIDSVSGATYTSGGYISSLQSALDKAGL